MNWKARHLLIAESLYQFSAGLFGPLYAVYVEKIGGDLLTAGWAWALFAIVSGITLYFMGRFEDGVKRDELFCVIGFLLASFCFLGYLFVSQPWQLFVIQSLLGFAWAFGTPTIDTLYSKNIDKKKPNTQWGAWEASMRIVEGISAFFGALIASVLGFKVLFVIMFFISLIAVGIVSRLLNKKY